MNAATPQALPEGVSSSAGINVSTAAVINAASLGFNVSQGSGSAVRLGIEVDPGAA
jgi:hypothetical protein